MSALLALGIAPEAAERAQKTPLPDGHGSLSSMAIRKILPFLEVGQRYSDAVQAAGYVHHSDRRTGEIRERLPYYGEILAERIGTGTGEPQDPDETRLGRAPNPTVHVALNELRRVVNAIIDHHGTPAEIVVETLRDLGRSKKQREAYEAEQKKNRDANDRRDGMLRECGMPVNSRNRMRVRLWEEQAFDAKNRVCPYTGTLITLRTALSDAIEEDHILPFAVSLDDSAANRMLVTREANRTKARRTPHEAFGASAEWPAILERAALLPQNKRWRFQPDALSRLAENGDFLARHLTDSATIARWAKDYLEILAPGKVRSVPGRLTALLRPALGLTPAAIFGHGGNKKDRNDHRHHVLDAVVVSLTDQGLLQRMTQAAKRAESANRRLLMEMEAPWEGFTADIARRAASLVVSHKPDIGWQAALHNDTAYGEIKGAGKGEDNVVVRRPVDTIIKDDGTLKFSVRDPVLAARIEAAAASGTDAQSRKAALRNIMYSGHIVRTVRATERLDAKQTISDRQTRQPYKVVKTDGNHRAELWRLPDGKLKLIVVSVFDAARQVLMARLGGKVPDTRPHPAAKLVLRLQKNDMILFGPDNNRQPLRVVKFTDGNVTFAFHSAGGNLKARDGAKDDPFKYIYCSASRLIAEGAQKIFVTPDGRVWPADRRK
jgi:CRISPR-associated endonuclease Csn1